MKFTATQTSLKSGRLSRKLDGRIDISEYAHGAREISNGIVESQGGVRKLQGLELIKDPSSGFYRQTGVRNEISWFGKIDTDVYRFGVENVTGTGTLNIRVYDSTETFVVLTSIVSGGGNPQDERDVEFTQYEDVIYITLNSDTYNIVPLKCYKNLAGNIVFESITGINTFSFLETPYLGPNTDQNKQLKVSSTGTVLELVDRGGTLLSTSVDNIINYAEAGEFIYAVGVVDIAGDKVIHSNYFRVTSAGASSLTVVPMFFQEDGVTPYLEDGQYGEWYYQAWSSSQGYPRTACAFNGRMIFGGTPKKPCTIFASAVGNPSLMSNQRLVTSAPSLEGFTYTSSGGDIVNTDPFVFTLATKRDTAIRFLEATQNLIVGTNERVYINRNGEGILGPQNVNFAPHVTSNCDSLVITYDNNVLYTANGYKDLIELSYSDDNGSFVSKRISMLSDDLYENSEVRQLTYNDRLSTVVVTMEDGTVHLIAKSRESEVLAYSTFSQPNVDIFSVSYNQYTGLCFVLMDMTTQLIYNYQNALWDMNNSLVNDDYLAAAIDHDQTIPSLNWSYPYGNEGDTIYWIDQDTGEIGTGVLGDTGGGTTTFTVAERHTHLRIGYPQEVNICLMPIEAGQQFGTAQMGVKRVDQVGVRVYNSLSYKFKELNSGYEEQVIVTPDGTTPTSGQTVRSLSSASDREQVICVSNKRIEPFHLVSISMRGLSND